VNLTTESEFPLMSFCTVRMGPENERKVGNESDEVIPGVERLAYWNETGCIPKIRELRRGCD